jgi:hypothetical protein
MLRGWAIYWLDLFSTGWFGRASNASDVAITDAIWSNASHVLSQWKQLLASPLLPQHRRLPRPSIAIFADEVSAAARPLLGKGGMIASGYAFEDALLQTAWQVSQSLDHCLTYAQHCPPHTLTLSHVRFTLPTHPLRTWLDWARL